jgi:hypothetical protein
MAVENSESGKAIATLPIGDPLDRSAYDPDSGLILNSTGEGTVDGFRQESP